MRAGARLLVSLGLVLLAGFFACGGNDNAACVPGRAVKCACDGGLEGQQTCRPDGSGYQACLGCTAVRAGFTDMTQKLGLPDTSMSCAGFEDFDNDGKLDLILSTSTVPSEGLIYAGHGDGTFAKTPVHVGKGPQISCALGDIDRDGHVDLILTMGNFNGGASIEYWHNRGDFHFELDKTGIALPEIYDRVIIGLGVWDFDQDGWLDLVAGRLLQAGQSTQDCQFTSEADYRCLVPMTPNNPPPLLFHNDHGVLKLADPARAPGPADATLMAPFPGTTNAIAFADFDRDGRSDMLLMNDFYVNQVYLRGAGGRFVHGETAMGIAEYNHGMGAAIADFDGDGLYDIYGADLGPNNFWFGKPDGTMENRALALGISAATHFHSNWSPLGEDFDLDGRPDVFVAASGVVNNDEDMQRMAGGHGAIQKAVPQYDLLFWNDGAKFTPQKLMHRAGQPANVIFAASAAGDPDGDGDLDILVAAGMPAQFRYLRNDARPGNYLVVDLTGTTSNIDGIGAEVSLVEGGKVFQMRTVGTQGTVGSTWRRAHFGLGARTTIEEVRVKWPSGKEQKVGPVAARQTLKLTEP